MRERRSVCGDIFEDALVRVLEDIGTEEYVPLVTKVQDNATGLSALLSSNTVSARLPEPGYVTAFLQHAAAFNDVGLSTLLSNDAVLVRLPEPGYVAALLQLAAALGAGRLLSLAGKRPGTLVRLLEHNFVKNIIRINTESGLAAAIASIGVN
jgi:hypothetical protein